MQSNGEHAYGREGLLTRVREEQLTEHQLWCRMKEVRGRRDEISSLQYYSQPRKNVSPGQGATSDELYDYFTSLWEISKSFLQLKLAERLDPLTSEERRKELWTAGDEEFSSLLRASGPNDKREEVKPWTGFTGRSYRDPKYQYYVQNISKEETLRLIWKKRAAMTCKVEVILKGLKERGLDERSEFWPVDANSGKDSVDSGSGAAPVASEKQNSVPIMFRSSYQRLIASKLIFLKLGVHYMKVARCILADNEALPEIFHNAILTDKSITTLDQLLIKNDECKTKFMKSVSGVRCALRKRGF